MATQILILLSVGFLGAIAGFVLAVNLGLKVFKSTFESAQKKNSIPSVSVWGHTGTPVVRARRSVVIEKEEAL